MVADEEPEFEDLEDSKNKEEIQFGDSKHQNKILRVEEEKEEEKKNKDS